MIIRPSRIKELNNYLIAIGLPIASTLINSSLASTISLLASGGLILKSEFKRLSKKYRITNDELIKEEGIIKRLRTNMYLRNIVQIKVNQKPIERLLNYGDLEIYNKSSKPIRLNHIRKPQVIVDRIKELLK